MRTGKIVSFLAAIGIAGGLCHVAFAADTAKDSTTAPAAKSVRTPAQRRGGGGRGGGEPRARGIPQFGSEHHMGGGRGGVPVRHQVFHEARPLGDIRRDPHLVMFDHVGWRPVGNWNMWYRSDWGVFWRVTDWTAIRSVTCEAVNSDTGDLFPVTEVRADSWYWNTGLVNNVAARALDECVAEDGNPEACTLVDGECWNSLY